MRKGAYGYEERGVPGYEERGGMNQPTRLILAIVLIGSGLAMMGLSVLVALS